MAKIFDLVTSSNITAYWTEKNKNEQPMLGETLFPKTTVAGTELEWIKGASNQPVALRLSSYDAKAIRRDVQGIEKYKTEMPFFKESFYIDEKLRQQLNNVINSNNKELIDRILGQIYKQEVSLIDATDISLERMRMQLLTTGALVLSSNGQGYTYDYGLAEDQKKTVKKSWSDPAADVISDINSIIAEAKAKGFKITRAICNSSVTGAFANNTAIKNALYVFANGTVTPTDADALSYVESKTKVSIVEYDNVYVDENGVAHKYIPDNTIVFLPDGNLGETALGITPEESDLLNSLNAEVSIINGGVAVTTHEMVDPVNVETKVSMVALPSFEQADKIYILDTEASA